MYRPVRLFLAGTTETGRYLPVRPVQIETKIETKPTITGTVICWNRYVLAGTIGTSTVPTSMEQTNFLQLDSFFRNNKNPCPECPIEIMLQKKQKS